MVNPENIDFYLCPNCLSDRLVKKSEKIICQECQAQYLWPEGGIPNFTVFERQKKTIDSSRKSPGTELVLDVGAGTLQEGTFNIDIRDIPGINVICNALYLPFRENTFAKVIHNQVLEHFRYEDSLRLLKEIYRVLKPGGVMEFWTPNFQAMGILHTWLFAQVDLATNPKLPLTYCPLSGVQDYYENVHLSHWNRKLVNIYVKTAGFAINQNLTEQIYPDKFGFMNWLMWLAPNRRGQIHFIGTKPTKDEKSN